MFNETDVVPASSAAAHDPSPWAAERSLSAEQPETTALLPLNRITPSPNNYRKSFPAEEMEELVESIALRGLSQPIMVRPIEGNDDFDYEIIFGERRFRAFQTLGLPAIEAKIRTPKSPREIVFLQLTENMLREDPSPLDEARCFLRLSEQGLTHKEIARELGKTHHYVATTIKLCEIPDVALEHLESGRFSKEAGIAIGRIPFAPSRLMAVGRILKEAIPSTEIPEFIRKNFCLKLNLAIFPQNDKTLVPGTPACGDCPKLMGNCREAYPDMTDVGDNTCTDHVCFTKKTATYKKLSVQRAEQQGYKILSEAENREVFGGTERVAPRSEYLDLATPCGVSGREDAPWINLLSPAESQSLTRFLGVAPSGRCFDLVKKEDLFGLMRKKGNTYRKMELDFKTEKKAALKRRVSAECWQGASRSYVSKAVEFIRQNKVQVASLLLISATRQFDQTIVQPILKKRGIAIGHGEELQSLLLKLPAQESQSILAEILLTQEVSVDGADKFPPFLKFFCETIGLRVDTVEEEVRSIIESAATP